MSDWNLKDGLVLVLATGGVGFILVSILGLLRLPDALCRCHALAKGMTLGISLLLAAAAVHLGIREVGLKLGLAIVFQFITIPVAGHLLMLLAYRKNLPRWKERPIDQGGDTSRHSSSLPAVGQSGPEY